MTGDAHAPLRRTVDLNADIGEGAAHDDAVLREVTSANVACGAHAGGPAEMRRTILRCLELGVAVGAHPGFEDREHFGRRELALPAAEVTALVARQLERIARIADEEGATLAHVKAHGALYNIAARDEEVALAIADAVRAHDERLVVFGLAGSRMVAAAARRGLSVAAEAFLDRGYMPDGSLVPRTRPDALLHDPEEAARRAVAMVHEGRVTAVDGTTVVLRPDTCCVHGDGENAAALIARVRRALEDAGVAIAATRGRLPESE